MTSTVDTLRPVRILSRISLQLTQLRRVIDAALTDTMYGLLLGLDGEASIGSDQRTYRIFDEENERFIASPGEIEAAAYECFHGKE